MTGFRPVCLVLLFLPLACKPGEGPDWDFSDKKPNEGKNDNLSSVNSEAPPGGFPGEDDLVAPAPAPPADESPDEPETGDKKICSSQGSGGLLENHVYDLKNPASFASLPDIATAPIVTGLSVPASADEGTALPLIVSLHGALENTAWMVLNYNLLGLSDRKNFILAEVELRELRSPIKNWQFMGDPRGLSDYEYLHQLITGLKASYNIDKRRVFLFGHSSGGMVAMNYACHYPGIAAVATDGAGYWKVNPVDPYPYRDVQVLGNFCGYQFSVLSGLGEQDTDQGLYIARNYEYFRAWNQCAGESQPPLDPALWPRVGTEKVPVRQWRGTDCQHAVRVEKWLAPGKGHLNEKTDLMPSVTDWFFQSSLTSCP